MKMLKDLTTGELVYELAKLERELDRIEAQYGELSPADMQCLRELTEELERRCDVMPADDEWMDGGSWRPSERTREIVDKIMRQGGWR